MARTTHTASKTAQANQRLAAEVESIREEVKQAKELLAAHSAEAAASSRAEPAASVATESTTAAPSAVTIAAIVQGAMAAAMQVVAMKKTRPPGLPAAEAAVGAVAAAPQPIPAQVPSRVQPPRPAAGVVQGMFAPASPSARLAASTFALSAPQSAPRNAFKLNELNREQRKIRTTMDPRLQMAVARGRSGVRTAATASTASNEIPVIAKVSNLEKWDALSEVRNGTTIGKATDGNWIVTARIPVSRIEAVRAEDFVQSLKASRPVRPALANSVEETGARPDLLPAGTAPSGGDGVVVGIVDFGCDFAHQNFRKPGGATRIEAIWQQSATGAPGGLVRYGRLIRAAEIDAALTKPDPYAFLGYGPEPDSLSQTGTHGTHVMDIAAGNGGGSGVAGYAPQASIIFVDLAASDVPWSGAEVVGKNFGDSVQLSEAIEFIFAQAGNRPCVINLSLGTNGGPHDGSTLVEQGIDVLIAARPNRSVVIAASNSHEDGIHAAGTVPASGSVDLPWELRFGNEPAEIEIWIPAAARVAFELIGPDGTSNGVIEPGDNQSLQDGNKVIVVMANQLNEPSNGDTNIGIYIAGVFPAGTWTVRLHSRNGVAAPFHAWVERYDVAQSAFPAPNDNTFTLGSISCGRETIVVGSYDGKKVAKTISFFSSEGPTRDGRQKPDISAPGHGVHAAWSRTGTLVTPKSGTSMAAPAVTGLIALMYAEAVRKGGSMTALRVRQLLTDAARQNPPATAAGAWDARYGFGRLSAAAIARVP
jgi:subtilisin family serine protease